MASSEVETVNDDEVETTSLIRYNHFYDYLREHDLCFQVLVKDLLKLLKIYHRAHRAIATPVNVNSLPLEVSINILQYCDARGLCALQACSRQLKALAGDSRLWEQILETDFSISSTSIKIAGNNSSKKLFQKLFITRKSLLNLKLSVPAPSAISSAFFSMLMPATVVH